MRGVGRKTPILIPHKCKNDLTWHHTYHLRGPPFLMPPHTAQSLPVVTAHLWPSPSSSSRDFSRSALLLGLYRAEAFGMLLKQRRHAPASLALTRLGQCQCPVAPGSDVAGCLLGRLGDSALAHQDVCETLRMPRQDTALAPIVEKVLKTLVGEAGDHGRSVTRGTTSGNGGCVLPAWRSPVPLAPRNGAKN